MAKQLQNRPNGVQVDADHYTEDYDALYRWISYWYQVREAKRLRPGHVLEIGVGNGTVSAALSRNGMRLTTLDLDPELGPGICGDVRQLPFADGAFDVVLCAQVLEHLPYNELPALLAEIRRVTCRHAVITLPCSRGGLFIVPTLIGVATTPKLALRLPLPNWLCRLFIRQHKWEIGRLGYPIRRVREAIKSAGWRIKRELNPFLNTYHHFFVLEKRADARDSAAA